jgi:hypothetical protein
MCPAHPFHYKLVGLHEKFSADISKMALLIIEVLKENFKPNFQTTEGEKSRFSRIKYGEISFNIIIVNLKSIDLLKSNLLMYFFLDIEIYQWLVLPKSDNQTN